MKKKALHIGIDFSLRRADVGLFGPAGQPLTRHHSLANSRTGYAQFRELVMDTIEAYGFEEIFVSGEATSTYWMPFFLALAKDETWEDYDLHQYLLNPRWVKWFKKCFSPDHKTDKRDTFYITERTRNHPPAHEWKPDLKWLCLRLITRLRFHLVQDLTREKNYFQAYLFMLSSAYTQYSPFSTPFTAISKQILADMDCLERVKDMDTSEVVDMLQQMSIYELPNVHGNAQNLQTVAAESFQVDEKLQTILQTMLDMVMDHICFIERQINQLDKWIAAEAKHHPEIQCLRSIPGIGLVFGAGIAAEIGDLNRFFEALKWDRRKKCFRQRNLRDVDAAIAKLAGLWWPRASSGEFESEERRMAKSGNRYLRYYLIEAANQLRRRIPAYSSYYARKHTECKKFRHKRALVLTARKSIRLYVGLLHRKETFCSEEMCQ